MILRDYQKRASDAVFREWQEVDSTLIVYPTGLGKTIVFSDVIRRAFPRRAIVLAHREELIFQARDKIRRVSGLTCEIEMGQYKTSGENTLFGRPSVIVSTIQTQCSGGDGGGRMGKFDPMQFGVLIVDEAHHACAGSYRRVLDYYRTNPKLKILGVTATPDRADEEALGQVFESVADDYEILDAINDGWLVPIEQQMVHVAGLDFSSIRTTAGDLNGADLAAVMEAERNCQEIASASIQIIKDKRALAFTASVKHAQQTAEIFNRHRPGMAAWVCGETDKDERRQINADFDAGKIQVLCNCGTHTEGFDSPGVEVIIMGRPTKSRSLYAQMAGRSTRPLPDTVDNYDTPDDRKAAIFHSAKPSALIIDFVGNSGRHKLMTSADILGGNVSDEVVERAIARAKKSGAPVRVDEALREEEEALREERRLADEARRARLVAKVHFRTQDINPFDAFQLHPVKSRGWDNGKSLSEKQRSLLLKQGVDPDAIPYSQAKQLIGEFCRRWSDGLCTFKQARLLTKHGYETSNITMKDASTLIDALAKNGWKRPT